MSQKTRIDSQAASDNVADSLYAQTEGKGSLNRTFIPGMKLKNVVEDEAGQDASGAHDIFRLEFQSRPVAGILYSISRSQLGEIFPVYVGRNTIGNNPESDIYLSEATVAPNHALLLIRMITFPDGSVKVTMSISDQGSDYGTRINGVRLDEEVSGLSPNDLVSVGNAYKFLFIPLDPHVSGLNVAEDFKATPRVENRPMINTDYLNYISAVDNTVYPNAVGEADEQAFYGRSVKAKEDHSSKKTL